MVLYKISGGVIWDGPGLGRGWAGLVGTGLEYIFKRHTRTICRRALIDRLIPWVFVLAFLCLFGIPDLEDMILWDLVWVGSIYSPYRKDGMMSTSATTSTAFFDIGIRKTERLCTTNVSRVRSLHGILHTTSPRLLTAPFFCSDSPFCFCDAI